MSIQGLTCNRPTGLSMLKLMIAARDLKLKIKEVPITFSVNASRKSFVKVSAIIEFVLYLIMR